MDNLVTTHWLAQNLGAADLAIVDSTLFLPGEGRDPVAEFRVAHIPGARFLDIDAVSDKASPSPHMLPSAAVFGEAMRDLGVGRDDRIIVYDNSGLRTAARGWFMIRHFGAERVAILDGGFQKWRAEGRPVESGDPAPRKARFDARERPGEVIAKAEIAQGLSIPLLDARGPGRFAGTDADPRPGVASGHIPGARNLPYAALYRDDGTLRSDEELAALFDALRVDPRTPFVASCGSGVTANSIIFAAHRLGGRHARLYDGSWSEWGADPTTPKAKGPSRG
ncbi:3-mercaptopyruvate sulfurtransferase [Sphingomonas xanthus]|uniref:Sulfurtransferase n=1 Tax=Sphingomonas xanthus TaxID=2594473 RepID=A0A516IQK3_9SPHN|nr:3-mercaptopyruvate sulfurtransferase [Sphingomonas xanthus]QDP19192.1 3-mercaptopyruvate sulfurtransferase [Sphingomonas xanthus]